MTDIVLGKLITGPQSRDAIHIAVAPVIAHTFLKPGEHVGFVENGNTELVGHSLNPVGIIDPFLTDIVRKGQRCNMLLYQNTVTGMRHEWEHPAFKKQDVTMTASVAWLTHYASLFEMSYEKLIEVANNWVENGQEYCLGFDTPDEAWGLNEQFWEHYEDATGKHVKHEDKSSFFRCAC